jgi:16S rRNA (uracil1498-N3)-methyltransferase
MSDCVRMATELGVARILPVICDYSVAQPDTVAAVHWRAEAIAAMKQSGNSFFPEIGLPVPFQAALAEMPETVVFGDLGLTRRLEPDWSKVENIAVCVGPEGGFSDAEKSVLLGVGAVPVAVGRWTLRVETAVPALLGWLYARGILT